MNKCPVCDKEFDDEEFQKHIEDHTKQSILNKPIEDNEPADTPVYNKRQRLFAGKVFDKEKFEELIEPKIKTVENVDELVDRRNFIEQVKRIYRTNPFCYVLYFARSFMNGASTNEIIDKFHILNHISFKTVIEDHLRFRIDRYLLKNYNNALELNLKVPNWEQEYKKILESCEFFKNELDELFFYNVLQAHIIILLMDERLEKGEIANRCHELKNHYDLFRFVDKNLEDSFNKLIDSNLEGKIAEIVSQLLEHKVIKRDRGNPKKLFVDMSIDKIKKNITRQLKIYEKLTYNSLRALTNEEFPGLKLIPKFGVFFAAIKELESEEVIHIESRSNRVNDVEIFLNEDYQKIEQKVKSFESDESKIPFRGREISPDKFIEELLELEKGDFGGEDDQVTRLAGLVLAESVKLQTPHEDIKEFDFRVDIKNYNFRPEQLERMSKLDFKINSEIIHVKVMLEDILNLKKYDELREKIPQNEQGLVITFKKVPKNVKRAIEKDRTIQVIGEEDLKIWSSITPRIPARMGSISKIYWDPLSKLENKIVKVNSVFYEKGIAIVDVFPEMEEKTVLARTLEEVELPEASPNNFIEFSNNYSEFLEIIEEISDSDDYSSAFFKNEIKEVKAYSEYSYAIKFEDYLVNLDTAQNKMYEKENIHYKDGFRIHQQLKIMDCSCFKWKENKSKLCSHLITSLDYVARNSKFLDSTWNDGPNPIRHTFEVFMVDQISRKLDNILEELDDDEEKMMGNFISKVVKS